MENRPIADSSSEQSVEDKNKAARKSRIMKRIGAVALVVSVPFVAPASQAIEYAATKTGDAVVDGGKRVVEDGVDMVQNFYQGIKDFFER